MDIMAVTEVKQITNSLCNRNQANKDLQRRPICINDSDNDFSISGIKLR